MLMLIGVFNPSFYYCFFHDEDEKTAPDETSERNHRSW
jgi:hypothetical protein